MRNFLSLLIISLVIQPCYAIEKTNFSEAHTDSDWLQSNLAHYHYTALVEIGKGIREKRYSSLSYHKPLTAYRYQVKIVKFIKGNTVIYPTCLIQPLELRTPTTTNLTGLRLLSFDKIDDCITIDTGVYPIATPSLIDLAKKIVANP